MKIIKIEVASVFKDPMVSLTSDDYPILYTDVGREGRGANLHGLQCSFREDQDPERYNKLMKLCDVIADATREIINLHK